MGLVESENEIVHLPLHLKWSGPRDYDLSDPQQRKRVYEIVLREGRAEDVRRFVDPDELFRVWDEIVLPDNVRRAWADYFLFKRGQVVCGASHDGLSTKEKSERAPLVRSSPTKSDAGSEVGDKMPITTVLLDAGGVILDESEHEAVRAEIAVDILRSVLPGYSIDTYYTDIEEAVRSFCPSNYRYVFWKYTRNDRCRFDRLYAVYLEK